MKLLFDQNLSHRIVRRVADVYPQSIHVASIGLEHADDERVWVYAVEHDFMIVSKDDDFRQRSLLRGAPPKVVWINIGNCTTDEVSEILRTRLSDLLAFHADPESTVLILRRENS